MAQKKDMGKILRQFGLVFVALIIIIFMSITSDVFLTSQNIINILRQISINVILSILVYTFSQECSTLCCLL